MPIDGDHRMMIGSGNARVICSWEIPSVLSSMMIIYIGTSRDATGFNQESVGQTTVRYSRRRTSDNEANRDVACPRGHLPQACMVDKRGGKWRGKQSQGAEYEADNNDDITGEEG
jgi:hypothetical protein